MGNRFYPKIGSQDIVAIKAAVEFLSQDQGYLSDPNCRYPSDVKELITKLAVGPSFVTVAGIDGEDLNERIEQMVQEKINFATDPAIMETEISTIYVRVKLMIQTLSKNTDSDKDTVAMLTNAVKLLEKLTSLAEVNLGHKKSADFKAVVMSVLEDVLQPDQRTEFVTKLAEHI